MFLGGAKLPLALAELGLIDEYGRGGIPGSGSWPTFMRTMGAV